MYKFSSASGGFLPVSVDFIKNFMPSAPGDYIKVYLFGLMQALGEGELSEQSICRSLNLTEMQIREAFEYWQNKGVLTLTGAEPIQCSFAIHTMDALPQNHKLYPSQNYISEIQSILGRTLTTNEVKTFLDFMQVYGLKDEIVFCLVKHCSSEAIQGRSVSAAYLKTIAEKWADEGINTLEKAEAKINLYNAVASGALRVIRRLDPASGRLPTADEQELYEKWTKRWGFGQDAILLAMGDTTAALKPSMKYLDGILRSYYEKGIISSTDINACKRSQANLNERLVSVLEALKYPQKRVTTYVENAYASWLDLGFSHDSILLVCEHTEKMGNRNIKKADLFFTELKQAGITQKSAVQKYLCSQSEVDQKIKQVFECAGITKEINEADRRNYLRWTKEQRLTHNVILYAAEISSITQNPLQYMSRVLQSWAGSGVTTLEMARKQNLSILGAKKAVGDFEQREYSKEHFEKDRMESIQMLEDYYE